MRVDEDEDEEVDLQSEEEGQVNIIEGLYFACNLPELGKTPKRLMRLSGFLKWSSLKLSVRIISHKFSFFVFKTVEDIFVCFLNKSNNFFVKVAHSLAKF